MTISTRPTRLACLASLVLAGAVSLDCTSTTTEESTERTAQALGTGFLTKGADNRLYMDGQKYDVPSVNLYDLSYWYALGSPTLSSTKLAAAGTAGIKVVRFFAAGLYDEGSASFPLLARWSNPATKAAFWAAMDTMVADAQTHGVKLVPSLVTGVPDMNESVPGCSHKFSYPLVPNTANRAAMKQFALDWANRYKNSTSILFWELGNEINLEAKERSPSVLCATRAQIRAYITEMAGAIKAVDANHLFASGAIQDDTAWPLGAVSGSFNDAEDFFRNYHQVSGVDIATVHLYGQYEYKNTSGVPQSMAQTLAYFQGLAHSFGAAFWVGEFGTGTWAGHNDHPDPMSLLLARRSLDFQLATAWTWMSKDLVNHGYPGHQEFVDFSIDPGEDDAFIASLREIPLRMGNSATQTFLPMAGDWNGDGKTDLGAQSARGLWEVSLSATTQAGIPAAWLENFGNGIADPACASKKLLTGRWNADTKTDIGFKCPDGRWYTALSDGKSFYGGAFVLSNFGNDAADPACAPSQPFTGDWNNDGKTDFGFKCRDGRWYVAMNTGSSFNTAFVLSGFGNELSDASCAPMQVLSGDWNADGKSDIGFKCRDGRWYAAVGTGTGSFTNTALWLSGFGNEPSDPACAPMRSFTGDWNGDGKTDIGIKCKDGRWYSALSTGTSFSSTALALSGFGNDNADPGGAPFLPLTGDWNGDGKTDIAVYARDGRWAIAQGNGSSFINTQMWLP